MEERARNALAATETRRQAQGKQLGDKIDHVQSEENARREAFEKTLREQANALRDASEAGHRSSRTRVEGLQLELQTLARENKVVLAEALNEERENLNVMLQGVQGQVCIRVGSEHVSSGRFIFEREDR